VTWESPRQCRAHSPERVVAHSDLHFTVVPVRSSTFRADSFDIAQTFVFIVVFVVCLVSRSIRDSLDAVRHCSHPAHPRAGPPPFFSSLSWHQSKENVPPSRPISSFFKAKERPEALHQRLRLLLWRGGAPACTYDNSCNNASARQLLQQRVRRARGFQYSKRRRWSGRSYCRPRRGCRARERVVSRRQLVLRQRQPINEANEDEECGCSWTIVYN
jgi:hypothetical protein